MWKLTLRACISGPRSRSQLALENLALRHQFEVMQRTARRRRLRTAERAVLSRIWGDWRRRLLVVPPDTVIRWHRLGWRLNYTTNAVESPNAQLRKVTKKRGAFPTDESVRKVLYLAITRVSRRRTIPIQDWATALNFFSILFAGRVSA